MKTSAKMAPTASVNAATGTPPETESTGAELDIVTVESVNGLAKARKYR